MRHEQYTDEELINIAAKHFGRMGGLVGGVKRWEGVSKEQRTEALRKASNARWDKVRAAKAEEKDNA